MTRDELLNIHRLMCDDARMLMERKNSDYAGRGGIEPFANFTRTEAMGITTTEKGMLVRMADKFSRLSSFAESGIFEVKDESLRDTCIDIINYAVILLAYCEEKKNLMPRADRADEGGRKVPLHEQANDDIHPPLRCPLDPAVPVPDAGCRRGHDCCLSRTYGFLPCSGNAAPF